MEKKKKKKAKMQELKVHLRLDDIILSYVNMSTYIKIYPYILEFGQ